MRRALAAAAALATGALAAPAAAYVRTSDRQTGVDVAWPVPVVPYHLSSAPSFPSESCKPTAAGDPVEEAVRASFATWEQGCAELKLVYGGKIDEIRKGLAGTAENVVIVRRGWCSQDPVASLDPCRTQPDADCSGIYDCFDDGGPADWGIVALTTVLYDPSTGRTFDADMEVNGWDGRGGGTPLRPTGPGATPNPHGYYFTCWDQPPAQPCTAYGQTGCAGYDLRNTVTHEAGHFIGLAHPCELVAGAGVPTCGSPLPAWETVPYAERTMYPSTSLGETSKRALSPDDVAGVCAIYPRQGGCGCGSGGAPGLAAALLAALALRPRVRRRARPRTPRPAACRR